MSSSPSSSPTLPTNTLIITDLENHHFEQSFLDNLRAQTELFGKVCFFSPIKSFHRVFVVYHSVFDAQRAKALLHNTRFKDITLRVYFGQHTELTIDPEKYYLHLPDLAKAHADKGARHLSPPGSPPVGYVDEEEMQTIDEFSLEQHITAAFSSSSSNTSTSTSTSTSTEAQISVAPAVSIAAAPASSSDATENGKVPLQINKLRIDTLLTPFSQASACSPRSPLTPTRLAFSPAKGSQGEQPFITIQDWGVCA
ncbi:hypothetical protein BX616_004761 [Lobosporangium transversale]|uniref:Calcipressin-domain-containing protein n=1 Tax=Lobosporangium transversale TaxID=64571 RepID=A0A1Y2GL93_9FUNG|nr:Calcipressin-domain-containing protein [Lobosporangium transversale]KAF9897920.1 hypothetical protein BX616_004761 [Lobosporangium transversale]ORZ14288.1 Calcipressin-domain-containing protein [Lobosporangium transversale]|eukprot:XP_021880766.1 Calcipressin-domain-containing protein [Lobosporangium transversale]